MSNEKYYAYVTCCGIDYTIAPGCGSVGLTEAQYDRQMSAPGARWRCPNCGGDAEFDDAKFEQIHDIA